MSHGSMAAFERLMLGFWMVFFLAIATTNLLDVLSRRSKRAWVAHFRAHNLEEVEVAITGVGGTKRVAHTLFALVLLAQALGALLFAGALLSATGVASASPCQSWALLWNVAMWQAFLLADTICKTYQYTVIHTVTLCAALITLAFFLP